MKRIHLSMLVGAALLAACSGEDGQDGTTGAPGAAGKAGESGGGSAASVSLVSPNKGVLDREIEVQIGGSGTKFADGAKLDFGAGVEVIEVTASSPTLLVAKLKIAANAKIGARSVKIGDIEAKDAFTVIPAIRIGSGNAQSAKIAQGGAVSFTFENNDATAFDTNTFSLVTEGFLSLGVSADNAQSGAAVLLAPPLGATGKVGLTFANLGPDGKPRTTFITADDALETTARTPTSLVFGTPNASENVGGAFATNLYKVPAPGAEDALVEMTFHVEDGDAVLSTTLWGPGGKAGDLLGRAEAVEQSIFGPMPKEAPYDVSYVLPVSAASSKEAFLTVLDLGGKGGGYSLATSKVAATSIDEGATAHDALASAQTISFAAPGAANFVKGTITDAGFDWYKITVAANEVVTLGVDSTNPMIALLVDGEENSVTGTSESGPKVRVGAKSGTLTAGDYYLVVGGASETDTGAYTVAIKRAAAN